MIDKRELDCAIDETSADKNIHKLIRHDSKYPVKNLEAYT